MIYLHILTIWILIGIVTHFFIEGMPEGDKPISDKRRKAFWHDVRWGPLGMLILIYFIFKK